MCLPERGGFLYLNTKRARARERDGNIFRRDT